MELVFGLVAGILGLVGTIPYIFDIVRGGTRPQRAAFLLFSISGAISFASQSAEGATLSLFFAGALMVSSFTIFGLSLKFGIGGFARRDKVSLSIAALILLAWVVTGSAVVAVVLITAFNTVAKVLVMFKVYDMPHTELLFSWILSTVASMFAVLSVGALNWVLLLPPLQNGITVGIITAIIIVRRRSVFAPVVA